MTAPSEISIVVAPAAAASLDLPLAGAREVILVGAPEASLARLDRRTPFRRVCSRAPGGQRANVGISLASGDWVVVLTGAERLARDWLDGLAAALSRGTACAHSMLPRGDGLPLVAVWRPAFAYGSVDGRIDNASQALAQWLTEIFPRHRHRILSREGIEERPADWLEAGAPTSNAPPDGDLRPLSNGRAYDPRDFWEAGGSGWVKWEAFQPDETEIRAVAEFTQPGRVLEIGCGGGRNARYFAGAECYAGVDISTSLLARARDRQEPNGIGLVCGDAARLPFADRSFDLVFAVSTIQHVVPAKIARCVDDIVRVARRYVCLIEFTEDLPGGDWFAQPHMFRHDYARLLAPHADLLQRRPTTLQIQPAVKEMFLFEKR